MDNPLEQNAANILTLMEQARAQSPYGQSVTLCAATKTRTPEEINHLPSLGITTIGENRVQELLEKYDRLDHDRLDIHFIGALQTNKVKYIIDKVSMIQSVDRLSLAKEIDRQAAKHNRVMNILCEINIAGEESKSGVCPEKAVDFVRELARFRHIKVCGLMAVPPICTDIHRQKEYFQKIMQIFIDISTENVDNSNMHILSFGMSGDFQTAIECGSTMIRLGTALFGPRDYNTK